MAAPLVGLVKASRRVSLNELETPPVSATEPIAVASRPTATVGPAVGGVLAMTVGVIPDGVAPTEVLAAADNLVAKSATVGLE